MPLSFPDIQPAAAEFRLMSNTQRFVSQLNGSTQTLELPGARWTGSVTFPAMEGSTLREFQAFLTQLRGSAGRFYYGDPHYTGPSGVATGTPVVSGASQTGTTLATSGWTPSTTNILRAGDYISFDTLVGRELKMVVADVSSDGSGNATLTIEPPIRTAPADLAAIETANPTCVVMLKDDEQTRWSFAGTGASGAIYADTSIEFVEAFV